MPELRKNELTGEWVSIAPERANRPTSFKGIGLNPEEICPFCKGNEHLTPFGFYKSGDGRVRIVKNKYPVVTAESAKGFGMHDVLIDTDLHDEKLHDFSIHNIEQVLLAIKIRINELEKNPEIKYIQVFKNHGATAGASQPHSHWQIVALPIIPFMQENIYNNALSIYGQTKKCYICDKIINSSGGLDIYENSCFKAYCSYASKFGYEIQIAPKTHYASFNSMDDALLPSLADALKKSLRALNGLFPDLEYNISFMNNFVNSDKPLAVDCMHFFIQIIPRRGYLAGFELSTACYINCVPPEDAARTLRESIDTMR